MSVTKFELTVQGDPVTVYTPQPGEWDDEVNQKFEGFKNSDRLLGIDVETTAIDDKTSGQFSDAFHVRLVQFGTKDEAWVLRVDEHKDAITSLLEDKHKRFVSHTNYDPLSVYSEFGVSLGNRCADTHLMSCLVHPGVTEDHGLKFLCTKYLDEGLEVADKELEEHFKEIAPSGSRTGRKLAEFGWTNVAIDNPIYLKYAGLDAIYVRRLWGVFMEQLPAYGRRPSTETWLASQTTALTIKGIRLDKDYTAELAKEYQGRNSAAREKLEALMGIKATSVKRIDWLRERGVEFTYMTKTGKPSLSSKDGLPDLVAKYKDGEVGDMLRLTTELAATDNFSKNLTLYPKFADASGRVHPTFKTLAAHTGRMSIQRPALQTLKKGPLRGCFIAEPGHTLISCDFANVELRVAAALSKDPELINVFMVGEDVHSTTARLIFGENFTKKQRGIGKLANFLTVYGGGWRALVAQGGLEEELAKEVIGKFRQAYPRLTKFGYECGKFSVVPNDYGRLIPSDPERSYANSNYLVQSTARDLLVEALKRVCVDAGYADYLWMIVHDEVIIQVPDEMVEKATKVLQDSMTTSFLGVPITAEATIEGKRWGSDGL